MKADPQPCLGKRGGGGDLRLLLPLIHALHAHLSPMSSSPEQKETGEIEWRGNENSFWKSSVGYS